MALDEMIGKNALLYRILITKPVKKISIIVTNIELMIILIKNFLPSYKLWFFSYKNKP